MILDWDFVLAATFIIIVLIPLYIYKNKIYSYIYKRNNFKQFINDSRLYLQNTYPKIRFNFDKIIETTKNETNEKTRSVLVAEDLLGQFIHHEYNPTSFGPIDSGLLWSNYRENCIPHKDKLPSDWSKRKDFAYRRDGQSCSRCGIKLSLDNARVCLLKPIEKGGQYNFENLQTLCNDCYKITHAADKANLPKTFMFLEKLLEKIK